jgi:methyl-accepting chemotaxis protein
MNLPTISSASRSAQAAQQQRSGVKSVGESMTQLDTATHSNAALAERATAASERLMERWRKKEDVLDGGIGKNIRATSSGPQRSF